MKSLVNQQKNRIKKIWGEPSLGFGDTVYKIADTLYLPHCWGCRGRRTKWNKKLKYRRKEIEASNPNIYLVVGICSTTRHGPEGEEAYFKSTRCFGWFPFLNEAREAVEGNWGSMDEAGYFNYIVISESPSGVYTPEVSKTWYQWDKKKRIYVMIDEPKVFNHIVCWGVG